MRLGDQDFPHERDQIVRTKLPRLRTTSAAELTTFVDRGGAITSTHTDTDSHGVSDPSGQARGHFSKWSAWRQSAKLPRRLPYLRVANVYANELRLDAIESIGVEDAELTKLLVEAGDLLIVEGNGSKGQIGRLAIWDGSIAPCVHQNHLIKVRLVKPLLPKWILYWLLSPAGRDLVEIVASSTSGLYTLSVNKVGDLPIAVPPMSEQKRVVEEIERKLSVVDELKASVAADLLRANGLRQSILQRAFSGALVAQGRDLPCQEDVVCRPDAEGLR